MSDGRERMLDRVRAAEEKGKPQVEVEGWQETAAHKDLGEGGGPPGGREALVAQLCERLMAYKAEVRRVGAAEVGAAVAAVCAERAAARLAVPPGLPAEWRPEGLTMVEDEALSAADLDALDGVVTGCTLAVAQSGTLVLTAAPAEGRRAVTLVPDLHICVVDERQVLADMPAALAVLAPLVRETRPPLTFISGPSATSDIELQRVEGVHGPRQMVVLVVA